MRGKAVSPGKFFFTLGKVVFSRPPEELLTPTDNRRRHMELTSRASKNFHEKAYQLQRADFG
jgi:hypothetical protein